MTIELEDGTPPEWMITLENKKRHHKLAHDVGAGAPCLNCNDACLGLDLHFWRKICRNCKCKKEVHDVKEENSFEQFEILFGDNLKCSDRVKKISLDLKCKLDDIFASKEIQAKEGNRHLKNDNDLLFDWIPADVPVNLASEYLQQLPLEKLPITGSAGAMFRRQQLQKQMPLHDFKVNHCHDLTDEETQAFSDYVDNLKTNVVGKGQITKILTSPTDSTNDSHSLKFPSFSNNLNSTPKPFRCFSENKTNVEDLPPPPDELLYPTVELKTPSAFVPPLKKTSVKSDSTNVNERENNANANYQTYGPASMLVDNLTAQCGQKLNINEHLLDAENNNLTSPSETLTPADIIRKFNERQTSATSPHCNTNVKYVTKTPNRFVEKSTPYPGKSELTTVNRNVSPYRDIYQSEPTTVASRNVDGKFLKLGTPEQFVALSWYVPNKPQLSNTLTSCAKDKDRNQNPNMHSGTSTMLYAVDESIDPHQQICTLSNAVATTMNADNVSLQNIVEMNCHQCKLAIQPGQVVVVAERAGVEVIWHPQCFVCVICQELLVDLVYFFHRGEVYCGRHYAEVMKIPRCFACDELIFLKEYTVAEGQSFHIKHFCCFECDVPLAGKRYVPKDNNPVCLPCYESKYGKECHYCEQIIKAGDSRVGWKELSWHATASCFKCVQCSESLLGGKFVVRNNEPLCSKECIVKYDITKH